MDCFIRSTGRIEDLGGVLGCVLVVITIIESSGECEKNDRRTESRRHINQLKVACRGVGTGGGHGGGS